MGNLREADEAARSGRGAGHRPYLQAWPTSTGTPFAVVAITSLVLASATAERIGFVAQISPCSGPRRGAYKLTV